TIPAGVDTGSRVRYSGEGEGGLQGGPPGDLYVVLRVGDHEIFERQENDIHCRIPISFTQAALGATIQVPTLEGEESLSIPPGTQSGKVFRLRGKGISGVNGRVRGDEFVSVNVVTPRKLNRNQRRLLEQLAELTPVENKPLERGLFDRVKDILG
ncbi:MAG: molecular chaperone DnaJ, partial [Acidobacteriota bacterium]|nr:molecular chaperone DnaJ [Acidobacteriota bacterium]